MRTTTKFIPSIFTSSGLFLSVIILTWLLTGCLGQKASEPPTISEPKISAPTPQEPGKEVGISIDVSNVSGTKLNYVWQVDGGEIVRGDGSPAITYRTPDEPGIYNVRVTVSWDDSSVEKVTTIRVEEVPASASASEPPTNTPVATSTDAPTPTHTPQPPTPKPTNTPKLPTDTPTPKPTNTPAPTNTPPPTPTSLVYGELLFEDAFDDNRHGWNLRTGIWIEGGNLHLFPNHDADTFIFGTQLNFQDFIYETSVTIVEETGSSQNNMGPALYFRSSPDGERFYQCGISREDSGYGCQTADRTVTPEKWTPLVWKDRSSIDPERTSHRITVVTHGSK